MDQQSIDPESEGGVGISFLNEASSTHELLREKMILSSRRYISSELLMSDAQVSPEELEKAHDQSKWAANMQDILARYRLLSDTARAVIGEPTRVAYGAGSDEGPDIYPADAEGAPVVVFVHGGGWQSGSASEFAFPAQMLRAAGNHCVALDFSNRALFCHLS